MGTSVSVAKYMKAPRNKAMKLAESELPPTAQLTQVEGIRPSWPGLPRRAPEINTPSSSNGSICLAKPHVELNHSPSSLSCVLIDADRPITPTTKSVEGLS